MDKDTRVRVYNKTKYDIGVRLQNGQQPNIIAGTPITLTIDDIVYIDSTARHRKPFSSGELVAVDDNGKELTLEEIGGFTDVRSTKHFDDAEIESNLKKSANKIREWLDTIKDPVEFHSIVQVAKGLDLPQSKMNIIREKLPEGGFFDE